MNIETNLISTLLKEKDWEIVDKKQVKVSFFSGKYKKQFEYIQNFVGSYGKIPSVEEFAKRFPDFVMGNSEECLAYFCDELRTKKKHNVMADAIEGIQEDLNEYDTEKAYAVFKTVVNTVENEIILGDTRKINEETQKRWEKYKKRAESGGITGIATDIEPVDKVTGGLGSTDLITVLGYTNIGKTWFLIILGVNLAKRGKKVLFVTREMSPEQVEKRVDAVWAGVSYSDFNRGQMKESDEEKFQNYLVEMEGNDKVNFIIELSTGGVSNVSALVDKHKPDVLIIDGGYLLTEDSEDGEWKGIVETWRGFKAIALNRKIPVVVTMQLKANKASLENIALAKYIAQDCDVILGMEQTEEMKEDKEVRFKPLKLRDSDMFSTFVLKWDFHKMDFSPIFLQGDVPAKGLIKTLDHKKEKVEVVEEREVPKDLKKVKLVKVAK